MIQSSGSNKTSSANETRSSRDQKVATKGHPLHAFKQILSPTTPPPSTVTPQLSGGQVLDSVLRKQLREMEQAATKGDFRKLGELASGQAKGQGTGGEGKPQDGATEGPRLGGNAAGQYLEALTKAQGQSREQGMNMLLLQNQISQQARQHEVVSNLLKVRNEAVSRTVRSNQ